MLFIPAVRSLTVSCLSLRAQHLLGTLSVGNTHCYKLHSQEWFLDMILTPL